MHPNVDLCLTVLDHYNLMSKKEFDCEKADVSKKHLQSDNVNLGDFDQSKFVWLLLNEGIIRPGDVSKINGDFQHYLQRCDSE